MSNPLRTQVAIIGGGPSGLLLALKLYGSGISCIVLERHSREYVLGRIRAGVLESGTVNQLIEANVGHRLQSEGLVHKGVFLAGSADMFRLDFRELTDSEVIVYGQTEITRDLYEALDTYKVPILHNCEAVRCLDIEQNNPSVSCQQNNCELQIYCDIVVGCDGYHGISRRIITKSCGEGLEVVYPFGWLGILSETKPICEELIYSRSERGFALASMRSSQLSRYYIQIRTSDKVENWSDESFWSEFKKRLPRSVVDRLQIGPSIEKSIAPLRTYVASTMQFEKLLVCGDAAHIVPPTGAKGLNLAASDVYYAHKALDAYFNNADNELLCNYSNKAMQRVWKATRFSWWMTNMLHKVPSHTAFDSQIQKCEFMHLRDSTAMQKVFAENYTGLPY